MPAPDHRHPDHRPALRLAIAQLNPRLGEVEHNAMLIRAAREQAAGQGADVVVTPEFSICGYPPEDLVRKPSFVAVCARQRSAVWPRRPRMAARR